MKKNTIITQELIERLVQEELMKEGLFDKIGKKFQNWLKEPSRTRLQRSELPGNSDTQPAAEEPAAEEPAAEKPAAPDVASDSQIMADLKNSTSQISLPHAQILKMHLKDIGRVLQSELNFLSREEKQVIIPKVADYVKKLDKMANPVVAEACNPGDNFDGDTGERCLKQSLQAKHGRKLKLKKLAQTLPKNLQSAIVRKLGGAAKFSKDLKAVLGKMSGDKDAAKLAAALDKPKMAEAQFRAAAQSAQIVANNIVMIVLDAISDAGIKENRDPSLRGKKLIVKVKK